MEQMTEYPLRQPNQTGSAFLFSLPFVLWGLVCLESHFAFLFPPSAGWTSVFFMFYVFVLAGLAAGTLAGFPRWAYPYAFWSALVGMWLSGYSPDGTNLSGIVSTLPLVVFGFALLARRSLAPLHNLLAGLVKDWTLFSLAIYTLVVWFILLYDENQHPYLAVFILLSTLAVGAGAWLYFWLKPGIPRSLSLAGSLVIIFLLSILNSLTMSGFIDFDPSAWIGLVFILGLILFSGYLTQRQQRLGAQAA